MRKNRWATDGGVTGWMAMVVVSAAAAWHVSPAAGAAQGGGRTTLGGSAVQGQYLKGHGGDTYVGIFVHAPELPSVRHTRAPMAVSLVVDTSGSMAGAKIQNARMAAASLLESLRDGDLVSVYAFNNGVTQIAPATMLNAGNRSGLMQRVQGLYAAGGTNLHGGLSRGVSMMAAAPPTHSVRRIFLISDGRANVGPSDAASLGQLAASATEWGTQITAIGVGYDYDQSTLSAIAVRSSGRLYHLAQPQQMAAILEQELSTMARSVALNAVLELHPAAGVTFLPGGTTGVTIRGGKAVLSLGALRAGQRREVLVRARLHTDRVGAHRLGDARLTYARPGESARRTEWAHIGYQVTQDAGVARRSAQPAVVALVAEHVANQAQLRAAEHLRQNRGAAAAAELNRAEQRLRQALPQAPPRVRRRMQRRARSLGGAARSAASASGRAAAEAAYENQDAAMEAEGY